MKLRIAALALPVLACSAIVSIVAGSAPASPQRCPNPAWGACVGPLVPGRTYTTTRFTPTLTYSVPTRGWGNYEDWDGNFLLVRGGKDLDDTESESADFVGAFTSIAAARFKAPPGCDVARVPGVPRTPAGIAGWIREQPELRVGAPSPAAIGGLRGLRVDVRTRGRATLPTVTCAGIGGQSFTIFLLYLGLRPSSGAHGVVKTATIRLYLLRYHGGTLVVEVHDEARSPGRLASLDAVARRFSFAG